MKVPVRCVQTARGGVRIETIAHISGGSGAPHWMNVIEIPFDEREAFVREFLKASPLLHLQLVSTDGYQSNE